MKKFYAVLLVGAFLNLSACTKKDEDESTTASTEEETKTSDIKTGSGVMAAIGDTLNSLKKSKGDDIDGSDLMDENNADYAASFFFCLATLSAADGASVETLLGQIA